MQEISLILLYVIVSWIIGHLLGRVNFVSIGIEKLMMLSSGVVLFFSLLNPAGLELMMWSCK
jgi:hypothetical protein